MQWWKKNGKIGLRGSKNEKPYSAFGSVFRLFSWDKCLVIPLVDNNNVL